MIFIPVFLFGACIGSFLNVCILRLPKGEDVACKASYCYGCGKRIAWCDLIPVLSWCFLRGRSRCCKKPFSVRYALIELLTGLLFALCWWQFEPRLAVVGMGFTALLLVAFFIDCDHLMIPDSCTVGGAFLGLWVAFLVPSMYSFSGGFWISDGFRAMTQALTGLLIGSGLLLWIAIIAEVYLKKEAIGFGDVKLMGCIGAFCGWKGTVFAIFGGAILGSAWILVLLILRLFFKKIPKVKRHMELPFGPFLATAAWIWWVFDGNAWALSTLGAL